MGLSTSAVAVAGAVALVACTSTEPRVEGTGLDGEILVSAAASLVDAMSDMEEAFEARHPGVDVMLNLAGSSTLREQIVGGAPADVFASADTTTMEAVVDAGEAAGTPATFAHNRLQIAVPADNPGGIASLDDLADESLFVGLCAPEVPCGRYAREVLANAGVTPAIDTLEPDARALLTKVAEGELDAAIIYATDVDASGSVRGIEIPTGLNLTADYLIVALSDPPNPAGAAAFVDFVLGDDGQRILRAWGFTSA